MGIKIPTNKSGATTARNSSQPAADIRSANQEVRNELVIKSLIMAIELSQMK
jgi:hypothetical protein